MTTHHTLPTSCTKLCHVIEVERPDADDKESPRVGEVDLVIEKNRFGPTACVTVAAQLHYSRFVDMSQT
ncbi:hypothetical protein [Streptomyces werraensis]|uniref:hypothetical protein n=1 Tax=Streptomyces werraensis TaxID=68284 RepID=UPI0036FFEE6C